MSLISTTIITLAAFLGGFFYLQPEQEPKESKTMQIESVHIEETIKDFYASIIHDQESIFQDLVKIIRPNYSLPHGTTPLSFAIEQKKYSYAQQLLRYDFTATLQDLQKAECLQNLETDPIKKEQAALFVQFLTKHLQDHNVLPNIEPTQRGQLSGAAAAAQAAAAAAAQPAQSGTANIFSSLDYQFIQATERGDVTRMASLKEQGANPNAIINSMRALPSAIAFARLDALTYLLNQNVSVTAQDIEQAELYKKIHATNENERGKRDRRVLPLTKQEIDQADFHCIFAKGSHEYQQEYEKFLELLLHKKIQESFNTEKIIRERVFDILISHVGR